MKEIKKDHSVYAKFDKRNRYTSNKINSQGDNLWMLHAELTTDIFFVCFDRKVLKNSRI